MHICIYSYYYYEVGYLKLLSAMDILLPFTQA